MELSLAAGSRSKIAAHNDADDFSWAAFWRGIFPENTAANVATIGRTKVRTAEYLLAGRNRAPSGASLIHMLRSPVGPRLVDALAGASPWRALERRLIDLHQVEQELRELQQQNRELEALLRTGRR